MDLEKTAELMTAHAECVTAFAAFIDDVDEPETARLLARILGAYHAEKYGNGESHALALKAMILAAGSLLIGYAESERSEGMRAGAEQIAGEAAKMLAVILQLGSLDDGQLGFVRDLLKAVTDATGPNKKHHLESLRKAVSDFAKIPVLAPPAVQRRKKAEFAGRVVAQITGTRPPKASKKKAA